MPLFSAKLGVLWSELALPDTIRAAHRAGVAAVECHWPYETDPDEVKAALDETGLPMLGLNTDRGDVSAGENGLSALPGREDDAKRAIDQAIAYANMIDARAIHIMDGFANGQNARATFIENLRYALSQTRRTILIEPLNRHDAPGYFLASTHQAHTIIKELGSSQVKLMFDCYHVGRTEGDLRTRMEVLLPVIGHIQFASVPDRGTPDHGEIDYTWIFQEIDKLGWANPLGAEYKPSVATDDSLNWLARTTVER